MNRTRKNIWLAAAAFRQQAQAEKAHLANFWFGLLSKLIFNAMFILFIDQLYARVGNFAGYSKNDFLFLYLVSQLGFYVCYYGIFFAIQRLVQIVRSGSFDLLLLKPIPHRSFLYISGLQPYDLILTAAPSMLIVIGLIHWDVLHVSLASIALGLVVWVSGIIICNTLVFSLALPVFKTGEATDTLSTFYSVMSVGQMPFSRLPLAMKVAALVIFPQILIAGGASEVMLMKTDALGVALLTASMAILSIIIVNLLWRYALRNYTSASS